MQRCAGTPTWRGLLIALAFSFASVGVAQDLSSPISYPQRSFGGSQVSGVFDPSFANDRVVISKPRREIAPFRVGAEWISGGDDGLVATSVDASLPLLFVGTPPPLVKIGFAYTDLQAAEPFGVSNQLYEYSIGLSWVKPLNERWTIRTMLGAGLATDNQNMSSDAWQFRGGVFAMYKRDESLTWTLGALATGRDDLPVIPAVGAVWLPNSTTRLDFLFPQPRANFLLRSDGVRQQWAYLGFGINGATWAYEQPGMVDDRVTYKDLRCVVGWETRPASSARMPFAIGRMVRLEFGYVFSRELEFNRESQLETLDDGLTLSFQTKF